MKKYDLVLVEFPFSDLSQTKLRPALIVGVPGGENYVLCQITTKKRNIATYEISLSRASCAGDIRFESNIYVDMLFTLHKTLIHSLIGTIINEEVRQQVTSKLNMILR